MPASIQPRLPGSSGTTAARLKSCELLISALGHRSMDNSDLARLQLAMKKFEQIGAANGVEQHRPMFSRPPLRIAVACPAQRPLCQSEKSHPIALGDHQLGGSHRGTSSRRELTQERMWPR